MFLFKIAFSLKVTVLLWINSTVKSISGSDGGQTEQGCWTDERTNGQTGQDKDKGERGRERTGLSLISSALTYLNAQRCICLLTFSISADRQAERFHRLHLLNWGQDITTESSTSMRHKSFIYLFIEIFLAQPFSKTGAPKVCKAASLMPLGV